MYIRQFKVTNYRSLKNVTIGSLSPFVILYGENDTGKSNILSFLGHTFRQKYVEEITEVTGPEEHRQKRPSGFWRGEIDNFSDNFYRNSNEPITFSITIRFRKHEIRTIPSISEEFLTKLPSNVRFDHLTIDGRIESSGADRAEMSLAEAKLDQIQFYDNSLSDASKFLPGFDLSAAQARDVFDRIMGKLDDAFLRIPAARFLTTEEELSRDEMATLQPNSFKNWLFQSSMSRDKEQLFRQVSEQFGAPPFEHGRISIARVGNKDIDAFIEDQDGLKLPIERKGSGVQQTLMILSYVAQSRSPLIGIEELEINLSPKSQTSIFNSLFELVNAAESPINQVFLTTHSPHLARRNEAERRGVWIKKGETKVSQPSEAEVEGFFQLHF